MNKTSQRQIEVYADWLGLAKPTLMGTLYSSLTRGKEIFSFTYHSKWLNSKYAFALDPSLQLFSGRHFLPSDKDNFGIFLDSSPDRWGRFLMRRGYLFSKYHFPTQIFF